MRKINIFEKFREYQSRKVDNPNYEPLGQTILEQTPTKEEARKAKHREYSKKYYEEHKEEMKEYYRNYHKKTGQMEKEYGLKGMQLRIYKYLLEYYKKGHDLPRGTKIARDLNLNLQSVYNTMFSLIKKGYAGRGAIGKYYLVNIPESEGDVNEVAVEETPEMVYVEENKYDEVIKENESLKNEVKDLEAIASKKSRKHIDGEDYSPGYVSYLKSSIKAGEKIISELKERVVYLEEKLEKVQVVEANEENKSDYLKKLEGQNTKLADEVIMLRKIVKYLSKYID